MAKGLRTSNRNRKAMSKRGKKPLEMSPRNKRRAARKASSGNDDFPSPGSYEADPYGDFDGDGGYIPANMHPGNSDY